MIELPLCTHCQVNRVKRKHRRICSRACYHASRIVPQKRCRCGKAISRQATQCLECVQATHRQNLARIRGLALASSRQRYVERLRAQFSKPQTKTEISRQAYQRGYQACWQSFQRAILRGDVVVLRERRIKPEEAA